jgi:hypothetical protein
MKELKEQEKSYEVLSLYNKANLSKEGGSNEKLASEIKSFIT